MKKTITDICTERNLVVLCCIEAILHTSLSMLRFFIRLTLLNQIDIILSGATIIFAAIYFVNARNKITFQIDLVLLLFMLLYLLISCTGMTLSSGEDYFTGNSNNITDMETLIMIYILGRYFARKGIPEGVKAGIHVILLGWSAVMLFILFNVFTNTILYPPVGGHIGMIDGYFFSVNCNRNHTGGYSATVFLVSVYMFMAGEKSKFKYVYVPAALINYVALVLSCSRTALLAAVTGMAFIVGIVLYSRLEKTNKPQRIVSTCISGVASGAALFFIRYPVFAAYSAVVSKFGGAALATRQIVDATTATMSNRTFLWKLSVEVMLTKRLLLSGVTPKGIFEVLTQMTDGEVQGANTHNQLLEIGTTLGIPALIAFVVWMVLIIICCYKLIFIDKEKNTRFLMFPMILIGFSVLSLAEAYLLFYRHFVSYVFFFICGLVYGRTQCGRCFSFAKLPNEK